MLGQYRGSIILLCVSLLGRSYFIVSRKGEREAAGMGRERQREKEIVRQGLK
jgi:hypothetical protein